MYAVIKTGGKQYRVQQGDVIFIEKIDSQADEAVTFDEVLLVGDGEQTKVGAPTVAGAKVEGKVLVSPTPRLRSRPSTADVLPWNDRGVYAAVRRRSDRVSGRGA